MASVIFGNTLDMLNVTVPPGGYIVAYDLDGVLKQKDEFGVITPVGGGPINISGTGSTNFIPRWNSIHELSSTSSIYDDGSGVVFSSLIEPSQNDVYDIGSTSSRWKDLYLGSKIDILTNLEIEKAGDTIAEFNDNGLVLKQDKYLQLIGGQIFPFTSASIDINYPYIIKAGTRIFYTEYNYNIYELDEDLNLVDTYTTIDGVFSLQYNATLERIYIGDWNSGSVTRYFDLNTNTIVTGTSALLRPRDLISYNEFSDRIYAVDYNTMHLHFYDTDYNSIGDTSIPLTGYAFGVTTNQVNGKIYVTATSTFSQGTDDAYIYIYEPTISGVNLVSVLTYSLSSFSVYNTFGSDCDTDRNRAYIGFCDSEIGNSIPSIRVIDGLTDTELTFIDLSEYGTAIRSVRYFNNQIIVGIRGGSSNYVLSINPDTYVIQIIKQDTVNRSQYISSIYDGSHYYSISRYDNIDKIETIYTEIYASITTVAPTTNRIHTLPDKSGTIAHLDDIKANTAKTVWVDATYGNNTTAEKYNFTKPYQSITAAMTAAVSGDNIYVRPGTYSGTITLKNGVNVWCDLGVIINSAITDAGATVNCTWLGYAMINAGYINSGITFSSSNSNIIFEALDFTCAGLMFDIPDTCINSILNLKFRNIYGSLFNGVFYNMRAVNSVINLTVTGYIRSAGYVWGSTLSFPWIMFNPRTPYSSTCNIKINELILTQITNSGFYNSNLYGAESGATGQVSIEIDKITDLNTTLDMNLISITETVDVNLKINQPAILNRNRILQTYGSGVSNFTFTGTVTCTQGQPILLQNPETKVIIKNSEIKRLSDGLDNNNLIEQSGDGHYFKLENCTLYKESLGTSVDPLVTLSGMTSNSFFINSNILLGGIIPSPIPSAFDAADIDNGTAYFINTRSNIDTSVNITDSAPVSGFFGNDENIINIII